MPQGIGNGSRPPAQTTTPIATAAPDRNRAADPTRASERIAGAFALASEATGTSFDYLLATSTRESDNQPAAAAQTSTAKGLFQFVDQTWLGLVKREGPSVGLGSLSEKIVSDGKGGWTVADLTEKTRILSLKTDPLVASVMAGRFTQENARQLKEGLGRPATDGELYAAHVLGASGAMKLMRLAKSEPNATAATLFPRAAAANSELFYGPRGTPRTAAELLGRLTKARDTAGDPTASRIAEAHAALAGQTAARRTDPATVALMVRAQAAALVGREATAAATAAATTAPSVADRRYAVTAMTNATGLPGAASASAPALAGGVGGWRATTSRDAFAGLMRSDAATAADGGAMLDAAGTPIPPALAPQVAARSAAQSAPQLAERAVAPLLPPAPTPPTTAIPPAAAQTSVAAPKANRIAGGGAGGIPVVDTSRPMVLAPDQAAAAPAATPVLPTIAAVAAQPVAAPAERPSRLVAAAGGAPAMPLPMVDAANGATRPSRLLFDAYAGDAAVAPGAVRVRTTTVVPPPAGTTPPAR